MAKVENLDVLTLKENFVRKCRKKLRQIENLEQLSRPLNDEERIKVSKKEEIREDILDLSDEIASLKKNCDEAEKEKSPNKPEEIVKIDDETKNITETKRLDGAIIKPDAKLLDDKVTTTETKLIAEATTKTTETNHPAKYSCDWLNEIFAVQTLNGHNDIVNCVVADGDYIISCSRDTTIKVWDATTAAEKCSLRGHTSSVTSILLLSEPDSEKLLWNLGYDDKSRVVISASVDCTVKLWMINEGQPIKSFYTYNEINCIGYISSYHFIVTGTEGGKLELWEVTTGKNLSSSTSFNDGFTNIKVFEKIVFASSSEGFISVWELREEELELLFSSEKLLMAANRCTVPRKIRALELVNELIYFGDDGRNVKILDWKTGKMKKTINHICEFGVTDAICSTGNEILTASYNLDFGYGSVNVRSLPQHKYLTSLGDGQTGRIFSIAATTTVLGKLRFVTAGMELKVWEAIGTKVPRKSNTDIENVKTTYLPAYNGKVVNSEMESSETETEEMDSDADWEPGSHTYIPREIEGSKSIFSWCSIL